MDETSGRADPWVLITDGANGQARSTLATVRALAVARYRPAVTVSGRYSIAGASRFCRRRVRVPPANETGFAGTVRDEITARAYVAVFPASDAAIVALDAPGRQFVDKGSLGELQCFLQQAYRIGGSIRSPVRFRQKTEIVMHLDLGTCRPLGRQTPSHPDDGLLDGPSHRERSPSICCTCAVVIVPDRYASAATASSTAGDTPPD